MGRCALDDSSRVFREWPFTYGLKVEGGETVIVQGVIDMLIIDDNGLKIIDFKTDNVSGTGIIKRAEIYRPQLELYGKAAEAVFGVGVAEKWLYFLRLGCQVEIN